MKNERGEGKDGKMKEESDAEEQRTGKTLDRWRREERGEEVIEFREGKERRGEEGLR